MTLSISRLQTGLIKLIIVLPIIYPTIYDDRNNDYDFLNYDVILLIKLLVYKSIIKTSRTQLKILLCLYLYDRYIDALFQRHRFSGIARQNEQRMAPDKNQISKDHPYCGQKYKMADSELNVKA